MADSKTILILGGGVGGVATARALRKRLPTTHRIVLVDRERDHVFAPSLLKDAVVREWVKGIARRLTSDGSLPADKTIHYVCLLGRKRGGRREIADFYNARGPEDGDDLITSSKPTWESYLNELAAREVTFVLHHVPTIDHVDLLPEQLGEIRQTLSDLLARGRTALVGCSAAMGRTGDVLREFAVPR